MALTLKMTWTFCGTGVVAAAACGVTTTSASNLPAGVTPLGNTPTVKNVPEVPVCPPAAGLRTSQELAVAGSIASVNDWLVLSVLATVTVCVPGTVPLISAANVRVLFPLLVVTLRRDAVPLTVSVTGMVKGVFPAPRLATVMFAVYVPAASCASRV